MPLLTLSEEATRLAQALITPGPLPANAVVDALHIAIATRAVGPRAHSTRAGAASICPGAQAPVHGSPGLLAEQPSGADAQQPSLVPRCGCWARLTASVRLPLKPKVSSPYQSQNHVCYNTFTSVTPYVTFRNGEVIV